MSSLIRHATVAALVLAGTIVIARAASADTIGPDCSSCNGVAYTLTYSGSPIADPASDPAPLLHETFRITLDLDTNSFTPALLPAFLNAAAIKVVAGGHFVDASLFSAPGGVAAWSFSTNDQVNNGADCGGGGGGWICADDANGTVAPNFAVGPATAARAARSMARRMSLRHWSGR